jgi:hypothetical protein
MSEGTGEPSAGEARLPRLRRIRDLNFEEYVSEERRAALAGAATVVDRWLIPAGLFVAAWFVYAWVNHGRTAGLDYFKPLADAFLHGRLGLTDAPSYLNELVPSGHGLYWVVYPPAPALVMVPAIAFFGPDVHQEWVSILLGAANVVLASWVLEGMGVRRGFRVVMSLAFAFGTIVWFSAQVGNSWHFAHVVAIFFMLLAIRACQVDAPTGLIGLLFAGAILSRLPLGLAAPFFVAYLADRSVRETGRLTAGERFGRLGAETGRWWRTGLDPARFVRLATPMAIAVALPILGYLLYNQARFGSLTETGYDRIPGLLEEFQYRNGFFSIYSIPHQLYAMFLSMPVQIQDFPWIQSRALGGLSIVLTSPIFVWAIKARRPDWFGLGAWLSIALIMIPNLTHADPGGVQFGYRYAQDIYPFLFLLTVRGLAGRIGFEAALALAIGFVVNVWGMASAYYDFWVG